MADPFLNEERDHFATRLVEIAVTERKLSVTVEWREAATQDASQLILDGENKRKTFPVENFKLINWSPSEADEQIREILDSFSL